VGIGIISTYPPRRCGLATVAWHLRQALLAAGEDHVPVVAMVKDPDDARYGPEVLMPLRHHERRDYLAAAERLNAAPVDAVILQHEFGIFGGPGGSLIQTLLAHLRKPVITVFHTVLADPPRILAAALQQVAAHSARVVALSHRDRQVLCARHRLPAGLVETIPLGVPAPPPESPEVWKARLGLSGPVVAMTFGLLGPGKGLETAVEAMGRVAPAHPDLVYLIVGATHPDVKRMSGEHYRNLLEAQARRLDLGDQVRFVDRYLDEEELLGYLLATDIYVTPYPQKGRGVSLTILYAAALGKAILTTPFDYAQELLAGGAGWMVPFGDPQGMARALAALASDPLTRAALGAAARDRTQGLAWPEIGCRYQALARAVARERPPQP